MAKIFVDSNSEFYNTYRMYRDYIGYKDEYSYRQWMRLPARFKAAALYVQFYNEITLAWYKVKTQWAIEEEGVECINQYLMKNVAKIEEDPKRFKAPYIYKVAYNCLYCLCIDPSKNKDRYYSETSETFDCGEDEVSWFDFIGVEVDHERESHLDDLRDFFESLEGDEQIYVQYTLGELTPTQAYRALKSLGSISSDLSKDAVIEVLVSDYPEKLRQSYEAYFSFY